jgi:hypothetical protein
LLDELEVQILEAVIGELLRPLDVRLLGPKKFLYCYLPLEGGSPSREFLDALPVEAKGSYAKLFERRVAGHQLRGDRHHPWTEKGCEGLYEYKDIQTKTRLMHTTDIRHTDVLLFGFGGKKENKVDQVHVNRAQKMRDEYRQRRSAIEGRIRAAVRTRR